MLMSTVYDLKTKLEKNFGNEFVDKEDEQFYVGRTEQTPEERATSHAAAEAECAAALEAYLAAKAKKTSSKSKRQAIHDKQMWLITCKSGHREYYAKESQFESWTKIDLKSLLYAPFYDPDLNCRGRGWVFHSRLEREVRTNFATMKTAEPTIRRNPSVRDPHTKRTVRSVIWPATDKEKIIPIAKKCEKGILKNLKFWADDPKMVEAAIVTEEQSIRIPNSYDLMSFHEEDIMVLTNHQIQTNKKYEECAKAWKSVAANILINHLFTQEEEQGGPQV
ncbi:hypothetical protein Hanom_Chr07g00620891 [Helianthus anomalus]